MRKFITTIIAILLTGATYAQAFTYSGYIYNANGTGAVNVPVKLYKRTTPNITGFTSQTNYNGHSYYRSTGSMTWTDAKQACINMNGHLVTIANASEQSFVFNTWPSGWIGFTDESVEGTFVWVTGEPVNYTNWNPGEPNNAGNEDYAQFVSGGKWNDLPNTSLPYVIEFDYIVTTTPWVLHQTVYTNASGYYSFNQLTNPSVEWYIRYDAPTPITIHQTSDLSTIGNIVLGVTTKKSLHWNMFDVNNDGNITISDAYYVSGKKNGIFASWIGSQSSALYTPAQFNILNTGTTNLKATYPGVSSFTISTPVNGGSANYYLIAPGYAGQVTY